MKSRALALMAELFLGTSRRDITRDPEGLEIPIAALKKLGIESLVAIGGDDMIRSATAVYRSHQWRNQSRPDSRKVLITIYGCHCPFQRLDMKRRATLASG